VCEARSVVALRAPLLLALAALAVAGCGRGGESPRPQTPGAGGQSDGRAIARGAPPALAQVYSQGGALLEGGPRAFRTRLRELRGHPVVVNKWASWCGPCREELPFFRRQAQKRGREMAFLGTNTNDSPGPARRFLSEVSVPFPSYVDQNGDIARLFGGAIAFPTTAFYGRDGRLATVKQGAYASERELEGDIERYAR
jgi:cytochrome c biogenesis protein CcmG, thiol:disulfide interchange protein DsbE